MENLRDRGRIKTWHLFGEPSLSQSVRRELGHSFNVFRRHGEGAIEGFQLMQEFLA